MLLYFLVHDQEEKQNRVERRNVISAGKMSHNEKKKKKIVIVIFTFSINIFF